MRSEGLLSGVLLNSQMGLSGMPFVGPDLGGYIGDGSKDLFKRWMQVGVFSPYLRNHKEFLATANEPWSYGEEAEAISRSFIGFRYRLMPYLYSKFYEASRTGMPIARSLALDHPFDPKIYEAAFQYQFLFGDAIMVVPVVPEEKSKQLYLPPGDWYDLYTDQLHSGGQEILKATPVYTIPLFVKASAVIPLQGLVQSTRDQVPDTLQLHIYRGKDRNQFLFYEDAGEGNGYLQGEYAKRMIDYEPEQQRISIGATEGGFVSAYKYIRFVFHGFDKELNRVKINNISFDTDEYEGKLLDPLQELEAYYGYEMVTALRKANQVQKQQSMIVENKRDTIIINW